MTIPTLHPAMRALADQELADIVKMLDEYPSYNTYLAAGFGARETGRLVAVDCLARLAETVNVTPRKQLDRLIARLHAWEEVTR